MSSGDKNSAVMQERIQLIEEMGRQDLIDLFKEHMPRKSRAKRKGPPLDQRVSITVTDAERKKIDMELRTLKKSGEVISMSQFIRNRAVSSVDINQWKRISEKALKEIEKTHRLQKELNKRVQELSIFIDDPDLDDSETAELESETWEINKKLRKIIAQNEKRKSRLSGRMSMPEAETVKWRAQKICLSSSDYLRMVIFGLLPDTAADSHLSFDAKRRFYISIINVANSGWGSPPTIYQCSQCSNYLEENRKLQERVKQIELSR